MDNTRDPRKRLAPPLGLQALNGPRPGRPLGFLAGLRFPYFVIASSGQADTLHGRPGSCTSSSLASPARPPHLIARFFAEPLCRALGAPVVVDKCPGAAGIIGASAMAQAAPDG